MPVRTANRKKRIAGRVHAPAATKRRLIAPEDLLRFHFVADPQIAPDGRSILFVKKHVGEKNEYVTNLWKVNVPGRIGAGARSRQAAEPAQFTSGGKDRHPRWSPDGSKIAFISGRDKPAQQIHLLAASGGEAVALTKFPEGSIGTFKWSPDGTMLAVSFREIAGELTERAKKERDEKGLSTPPRVIDDWWYRLDGDGYFLAQRHKLFIVDVAGGKHRLLYGKDVLGHFEFDWSPDSRELVVSTNRAARAMVESWKTELLRVEVRSGKIVTIPNLAPGIKAMPQWSPDGSLIAYAGREGEDDSYSTENLQLWVCDPQRGKPRNLTAKHDRCLLAASIADTSEAAFAPKLLWSRDSRRIFFRLGWHGQQHLASIARGGGRIVQQTRGAIDYDFGGLSDDGKRMGLVVSMPSRLAEVGVAQLAGSSARIATLTDFNGPLLRQIDLAPVQSQWIESGDGTRVQVWSMTPPRAKRGVKLPAILQVHGGPHAQYGVGFFHEFQVLAAAGYAVFFSNPRGSKGYGRDFCAAIRGTWGGADWEDVQAVTAFIKKQRFVNPRRVGIMGGSYGGYMTNWAVSHGDEYKAAITDRCVSNLVTMGGTSDYTDSEDRYWAGNTWDRTDARWNQSPVKYFGEVNTPLLIIHSEGDLRCNVEQAEQIFTILKLRRVPTRFVRYPSSTFHGLSRNGPPDLRLHRLHQILDWWRKYLR